jgi:hypothetical protein
LSQFERKITSVNGVVEEGVLKRIFEVVPVKNKFCIEFGAGDGVNFSFTRNLIENFGWKALLIEGDKVLGEELIKRHEGSTNVTTLNEFVTSSNIEKIFKKVNVPEEPGLLVIDIDGNDYYVWDSIRSYFPAVVCIEYNASFKPPVEFVIDHTPSFIWGGDDYYGASFSSMVKLAASKGYSLVHCSSGGDNLFFCRKEYYGLFDVTAGPNDLYQLPQYGKFGRALNGKGHPASSRNTDYFKKLFYKLRYYLLAIPRHIASGRGWNA